MCPLCQASFTQHDVFEVPPRCNIYSFPFFLMRWNNIPLCGHTIFWLCIHYFMDIGFVCFLNFFAVMNNMLCTCFRGHMFSFISGICLWVEWLDHVVTLFNSLRKHQNIFQSSSDKKCMKISHYLAMILAIQRVCCGVSWQLVLAFQL